MRFRRLYALFPLLRVGRQGIETLNPRIKRVFGRGRVTCGFAEKRHLTSHFVLARSMVAAHHSCRFAGFLWGEITTTSGMASGLRGAS